MKKRKVHLKIVSILLCISMLASIFSSTITAAEEEPSPEQLTDSTELWTPETEEAEEAEASPILPLILEEDLTKRGTYEKHFLCDDGSYIAVSYPEPVHTFVNGSWEDISYSPSMEEERIVSYGEGSAISLPQKASAADQLTRITAGDYEISWTVETQKYPVSGPVQGTQTGLPRASAQKTVQGLRTVNAQLSTSQVLQAENRAEAVSQTDTAALLRRKESVRQELKTYEEQAWSPEETELLDSINLEISEANQSKIETAGFAASQVEYPQALGEGVTLRYTLSPGKIKEEVVIDSAEKLDAYTVRMDAAGLSAFLDETSGVVLKDQEGKEIFRIAPPLLYDAADEISLDVGVSLEQSGDQCVIIYTPDRAWLEAPERQWPVVIDPTVTSVSIGQTSQVDNYVYNGQSSVVDGSSTTMYVGCYTRSGTKREHRTYWRLKTLPTIPSGGKISGASFHIRLTSGTSTMRPISLYKAASTWDSSTIRWSNKPLSSTYLGQQSSVPSGTEKWLTYGGSAVTSAVSSWYSSPGSNYGFVLQYDRCLDDYNVFYSSDYRPSGSLSYIPYVSINYIASAPVSQVCLLPTHMTLDVNETFYMSACVLPSATANQNIIWTSSDNSIATVSSSGMVCASSPGMVTITARSAADNTKYATATIEVNKVYNLSWVDSIFITQLTNPDCGFNQPGSNYSFDFEKAYDLLQLFKTTYAGGSYVKAQTLENLGYCAPGAGIPAEGLLNQIYNYSLIGKSYYDGMMELNAQWQAHLVIGLSFFYYDTLFSQKNTVNINNSIFNPDSPLDMLEKDGISFNAKHGSLTAWKGYRVGSLSELPNNAQTMYAKYSSHGWQGNVPGQTSGTCAGGTYYNSPELGCAKLPDTENGMGITYKEFDINNYIPELGKRDSMRFVRGSNGRVYYTDNHYKTFIEIR